MREFEHFDNLVAMFFTRADQFGSMPFLSAKRDGHWHSQSWSEVADQVLRLAAALQDLGLARGDRVMLISENRPEFCIADLAIMAAGGVTVPTYTTNTARDHAHILTDSGARFVILSNQKIANAVLPAIVTSPQSEVVISMEPIRAVQGSFTHHLWANVMATPASEDRMASFRTAQDAERGDLATIIYTSGTGGAPRGVQQHHGAILSNVGGAIRLVAEDFGWSDEKFLSFLPLSHAYEHTGGQFLPIGLGAQIYYAEGLEKLASNIEEVQPTIMVVVPRLFEVLRQRIIKNIAKQGKLANYLLGRAEAIAARTTDGRVAPWHWPMHFMLNRTLRKQVRQKFGGHIKAMVSGGAPLNPDVGRFFDAVGLTILQGYGQTETGPIISCNRPRAGIAMHTVGPPMDGVDVRIADDGEILVRGELVMHGYWNNPQETARVIRNGWLHTGDIGHVDERGRIVITDRKKDLIVNDKGDNIAPQRVEGILTLQPEIGQAMVHGDRRPHLVALIVPDAEWLREWGAAGNDVQDDLAVTKALMAAVDRVNKELSIVEKVRRIALIREPFSIENEMLTPSMKIRRHKIRDRYGDLIESLYGGQ